MTRGPYDPTPQALAYNAAHRAVSALVDSLAVSDLHAYRARTRLAGQCPPPGVPTEQQVLDAVAATAPPETSA